MKCGECQRLKDSDGRVGWCTARGRYRYLIEEIMGCPYFEERDMKKMCSFEIKCPVSKPAYIPEEWKEPMTNKEAKYQIDTTIIGGEIHQDLNFLVGDHAEKMGHWVCKTREQGITDALVKLGWTPPLSGHDHPDTKRLDYLLQSAKTYRMGYNHVILCLDRTYYISGTDSLNPRDVIDKAMEG